MKSIGRIEGLLRGGGLVKTVHPIVRCLAALGLCAVFTACGLFSSDMSGAAHDESAPLSLSLRESSPTRVTGTLSNAAASIDFTVERVGETRRVVVRAATGRELLDSSIVGHVEEQSVFGGRLRIRGDIASTEPDVAGDPQALEELRAMPEYALAMRLLDTLRERGIDPTLVTPNRTSGAVNSLAAGNHRTWYDLGHYEQLDFATWTFWIPTYVIIRNTSPEHWAQATLMCSWSSTLVDVPPGVGQSSGADVRCGGIRLFVRNTSPVPVPIQVHVE
jgi:hypothetical protein